MKNLIKHFLGATLLILGCSLPFVTKAADYSQKEYIQYYLNPCGGAYSFLEATYFYKQNNGGQYIIKNTQSSVKGAVVCVSEIELGRYTAASAFIRPEKDGYRLSGSNEVESITFTKPKKTGYSFAGWSVGKETATIQSPDNSVYISYEASVGGSPNVRNFYAHYAPNKYTVSFHANGGNGTMAKESFVYDTAKALTTNAYTRAGYTFGGWAKTAGGAKAYENAQSVKNLSTASGGNVDLYAVWIPNTYTVMFSGNGETGGVMSAQNFTYGKNITLAANGFHKTGYVLREWNTKQDGSGTGYTAGQAVSNLTTTNKGTVHLYAIWEAHPFRVTYEGLEGGTNPRVNPDVYLYTDGILRLSDASREGYVFNGWYQDAAHTKRVCALQRKDGEQYTEGVIDYQTSQIILADGLDVSEDVTLYAEWIKEEDIDVSQLPTLPSGGGTIKPPKGDGKPTSSTVIQNITVIVPSGEKPFTEDVPQMSDAYNKKNISFNAKEIVLCKKQSTKEVKLFGLLEGDYITKIESGNRDIVKVDSTGKITAGKKSGKTTITYTLASGIKKSVSVKVQSKKVKTRSLVTNKTSFTMKKGKKKLLQIEVRPFTSSEKITYRSSNPKVVTVSAKGKLRAKKAGSAVITVRSGNKKLKIKIKVKK